MPFDLVVLLIISETVQASMIGDDTSLLGGPVSIRWLYPFHIRRKRALMSTGSRGGLCPFAGTAATGHTHP